MREIPTRVGGTLFQDTTFLSITYAQEMRFKIDHAQ